MRTETLEREPYAPNLALQQEQDLFGVRLFNSESYNANEVAEYILVQEKTHLAEGMEMQQKSVRTLEFVDGHLRGFQDITMVDTNRRGLEAVQKEYDKGNKSVLPLIRRREHDIAFAEATDELMACGEIGETLLVSSPYLEELNSEHAKELGDWPEFRRGYAWFARKISETEMEFVDVSIDQSQLSTWKQTLAAHGVEIPKGTKSYDYPGYTARFSGIVTDQDRDNLITNFKHTYQAFNRPNVAFAHDYDDAIEATEFLDKYAKQYLALILKTHESIARTLQTGELDHFVRMSASRALNKLDCLSYDETQGLENLLDSNRIVETEHSAALANIIKAQRYGIWKAVRNMICGVDDLVSQKMAAPNSYITHSIQERLLIDHIYDRTNQAAAQAEVMPGCAGGASFLSQSLEGIKANIFGGENYSFNRKMHCVVCQKNPKTEEPPKMCGPCGICKGCDGKMRTATASQAKNAAWN